MPNTTIVADVSPSVPGTIVDLTTEIVAAYIARNAVPPGDMPALISTVHGTLSELGKPSETAAEPARPIPPISVRKSVTDTHIISLEDGRPYKALKRHLAKLGLTPAEYRAKWGLPDTYPMVCAAYARQRSALAKEMGLGQKRRKV